MSIAARSDASTLGHPDASTLGHVVRVGLLATVPATAWTFAVDYFGITFARYNRLVAAHVLNHDPRSPLYVPVLILTIAIGSTMAVWLHGVAVSMSGWGSIRSAVYVGVGVGLLGGVFPFFTVANLVHGIGLWVPTCWSLQVFGGGFLAAGIAAYRHRPTSERVRASDDERLA